jgi:two-component system sensor histidine kinase BaeS
VTVSVDAPDTDVANVDPVRLREVVLNLLANGIRHSERGAQVHMTVRQAADHFSVRVRDTGPGIPAEDLPRIFDRFQKGPRSKGTGLGLSIARYLAEAHGGQIAVESTVGEGSTFTVTLPKR